VNGDNPRQQVINGNIKSAETKQHNEIKQMFGFLLWEICMQPKI
jgi:hypothetical protein